MTNIFDDAKYKEASLKAIEFIKRQLNVNNYSLFPKTCKRMLFPVEEVMEKTVPKL